MPYSTVLPALASVLAMAGPAHPDSALTLTLRNDSAEIASVTLECGPAGGSHPHHDRACRTLDSVDGDFGRLPKEQILCPMDYAPVTATASGHWHARMVVFQRTYPNRCAANAGTASVFDFS
jgi:hypothetical protein